MMVKANNASRNELMKFRALSHKWWDPSGEFGALHDINPGRLAYIAARSPLDGRRVIDVGCGGGLLSEAMARKGAMVTGIDLEPTALAAAGRHMETGRLFIDYRLASAESMAEAHPAAFDVVTCMELLEHVPDPGCLVKACARLVKPGGRVFFATLNRTFLSYVLAILVAEHLLGIVKPGTHDWRRFVRPSDLARWGKGQGLCLVDLSGMVYIPFIRHSRIGGPSWVNYLACFSRPDAVLSRTQGLRPGRGGVFF